MADFLIIYIFHWVPEKAIYVGGHSLFWDARCAGIYIGFGIGLIWRLIFERKNKNLPPWSMILINSFILSIMFIDLISIWIGLREPSNDIRYLTGILFGGALTVYLYPAFMVLFFPDCQNLTSINYFTRYSIFLFMGIAAFFLKEIDNIGVFIALSGLSFIGFAGLIVILLGGLIKGIMRLRER